MNNERSGRVVDLGNGGGIHIPDHLLRDREAQREEVAKAIYGGFSQAYQQTVSELAAMVSGAKRRIEIAANFLSSHIQQHGLALSDETVSADVKAAYALADAFIAEAVRTVDAVKEEASKIAEDVEAEQLARFDQDIEEAEKAAEEVEA